MKKLIVPTVLLLLLFGYVNNNSRFARMHDGNPLLLAHRGLAQTFRMEGITNETNTALRLDPPEHPYLENTIPSMEAAFRYGADVVELDIQSTRDGYFAVFHDWKLDYRTDGTGAIRDHSLEDLKKLDVGYGYSPDSGKSYPFRCSGVGLMPSLDEVFDRFPDRAFLIHIKSNDPQDGVRLAAFLAALPPHRLDKVAVYGGDKPVAVLAERLPGLRVMSKATLIKNLILYMAVGWTGYVPASCRHTELHLPESAAPWLWGWPVHFLERMKIADTRVILVAGKGEFSGGFDSAEDLKRLPSHYTGGIWTNRIDRVGTLLGRTPQ